MLLKCKRCGIEITSSIHKDGLELVFFMCRACITQPTYTPPKMKTFIVGKKVLVIELVRIAQ